jgi:hypothetical protein
MGVEMLVVILLAWLVVGLFAAIAFGKFAQGTGATPDDGNLAASYGSVQYIRRNKRKASAAHDDREQIPESARKQAVI